MMKFKDLLWLLLLLCIFYLCKCNAKDIMCICNDSHACKKCNDSHACKKMESIPIALINEAKYLHPELSENFHLNETKKMMMSQFGICYPDSEGNCYTAKLFRHTVLSKEGKHVKAPHMVIKYGCISSHEKSTLTCKSHLVKHENPKTIACCKSSQLCNSDLDPYFHHYNSSEEAKENIPNYTTPAPFPSYKKHVMKVLIILVSGIGFAIFTVAFCIFCLIYRKKLHHMAILRLEDPSSMATTFTIVQPCQPNSDGLLMSDFNTYERSSDILLASNMNNTSGSGSGPMMLSQRTVGKQLSLDQLLGEGRFAQVWLGEWRGQEIAVKLFHAGPVGEGCWRHEIALHWRVLLRHPAVLSIVASDRFTSGSVHRPLLVTEYMPRGTLLQCFINRSFYEHNSMNQKNHFSSTSSHNSVSFLQLKLLKIAEDIVSGLDYLHTEISGTYGKPGIAHRDLKPSNIYIKSDWSCCIGDFSLAVTQQVPLTNQHLAAQQAAHNVNQIDNSHYMSMIQEETDIDGDPFLIGGIHASTPRYMAPEILNEEINSQLFEDFKRADIYSLGLIFWELVRWCAPVELLANPSSLDQSNATTTQLSNNESSFIDLPYYPPYQEAYLLHFGPPKLRDLMTSCESNNDLLECEWNPDDDEPSLEEMHHLICTLKERPRLPANWTPQLLVSVAPVSQCLINLMVECCSYCNYSRLNSLRIKKNLKKFHDELNIFDANESIILNVGLSEPESGCRTTC